MGLLKSIKSKKDRIISSFSLKQRYREKRDVEILNKAQKAIQKIKDTHKFHTTNSIQDDSAVSSMEEVQLDKESVKSRPRMLQARSNTIIIRK